MQIRRMHPGTLQLERSRRGAALQLGLYTLSFAGLYLLLSVADADALSPVIKLLIWLSPLFGIPVIIRQLKVLISGECITFSRDSGLIDRNGSRLAHFADVERLQIRTFRDSDAGTEYRLSLVLNDEQKIKVDQSHDGEEIKAIAEDIADLLGVEVTLKAEGGSSWSVVFGAD